MCIFFSIFKPVFTFPSPSHLTPRNEQEQTFSPFLSITDRKLYNQFSFHSLVSSPLYLYLPFRLDQRTVAAPPWRGCSSTLGMRWWCRPSTTGEPDLSHRLSSLPPRKMVRERHGRGLLFFNFSFNLTFLFYLFLFFILVLLVLLFFFCSSCSYSISFFTSFFFFYSSFSSLSSIPFFIFFLLVLLVLVVVVVLFIIISSSISIIIIININMYWYLFSKLIFHPFFLLLLLFIYQFSFIPFCLSIIILLLQWSTQTSWILIYEPPPPPPVPSLPPETIRCEATSPQSISVAWRPPPLRGQNGLIKGYRILYTPASDYSGNGGKFI